MTHRDGAAGSPFFRLLLMMEGLFVCQSVGRLLESSKLFSVFSLSVVCPWVKLSVCLVARKGEKRQK
jgi:hypothetical protein